MNLRRRLASVALMALVGSAASVVATATPASAATCVSRGGYSFKNVVNETYSTVNVHRGSGCRGDRIAWGRAALGSGYNITLYAYDVECDDTGITLFVHGYSVPSRGCGNLASRTVDRRTIGRPYNYWINITGTSVNSNAYSLPI
jgi:hypothetical protein